MDTDLVTAMAIKTAKKSKREKFFRELYAQKILFLFLLPAVVATLLFNYKPMYGIIIAFQKYDILKGIWGSPFIGLDNFINFLTRSDFYLALRNTVVMSALGITIGFPIPIIFAILINDYGLTRYRKIVQSISYLPHFLSWVIVAGLLYRLLDQDSGIVNIILNSLGIDSIGFFREPSYFWGIFTASGIWKEMGWGSILYLSAITGINPELYEAARADGANRVKLAWHVTLPGIMQTIVIMFILGLSGFFSSSFDSLFTLRNAMISSTSDTIDIYAYFRGIGMGEYGYATAIGLSQSVLSIIILFTANKAIRKFTDYSLF